jgi:hypothetical protein
MKDSFFAAYWWLLLFEESDEGALASRHRLVHGFAMPPDRRLVHGDLGGQSLNVRADPFRAHDYVVSSSAS